MWISKNLCYETPYSVIGTIKLTGSYQRPKGICAVTGEALTIGNMECHHKIPKSLGGTDEYKNLVWLTTQVHKLIHSTNLDTIAKYLNVLNLDNKGLKKS